MDIKMEMEIEFVDELPVVQESKWKILIDAVGTMGSGKVIKVAIPSIHEAEHARSTLHVLMCREHRAFKNKYFKTRLLKTGDKCFLFVKRIK